MLSLTAQVRKLPTNLKRIPRGLTLVELVVVLLILTVLATVAVQMVEPQVDQARYDATRKTLENIRAAVIGDPDSRAPDGTPLVSGFVADMGRPPLAIDELFVQGALPPLDFQSPPGDPDLKMAAGWNGPYLRLPMAGATRSITTSRIPPRL